MLFTGQIPTAAGSTPLPNNTEEPRDPFLEDKARQFVEDKRRMRGALGVAVFIHGIFLLITVPHLTSRLTTVANEPRKVYVVQQLRFRPPPAPPRQARPKVLTKKIPIPDPTPEDPEPIVMDIPMPEVDLADGFDLDFGIPEGPGTGASKAQGWGEALEITGDILAPVQIHAPQPTYTEEARRARIQGIVILRAIIDKTGAVVEVEILKGLTLGLSESAVDTVRTWRYKPATQDDTPVPVFMYILVNFRLT